MRVALALVPLVLTLLAATPSLGADASRIVAPPGSDVGLPFSAGVLDDDLLFLSGAIGNRPGTTTVEGDTAAQTRQTLDNLGAVLSAAGLEFDRVVTVTAYLADIRVATAFDSAARTAQPKLVSASTTVEADIALPGALLEISAVAARPGVAVRAFNPEGWPGPRGGQHWAVAAGDTFFLSGQRGVDPARGTMPQDAEAQAAQALRNIGTLLAAAELEPANVVACRVYLPDARDFAAMNRAFRAFFPTVPPARATVRARLLDPHAKVEIQCTAVRGAHRAVLPAGTEAGDRPFSPAVEVGGRLYLSGMVGRGADGYPAGVAAQTRVVLERLRATLAAANLGFEHVENATVFLSDIRFYGAMNEVYREVLPQPPPARATVGSQLMSPDALVEIAMIASRSAAMPREEATESADDP